MPAAVLLIAFVLQLSQQALSTVHAESQPHFEVVPSKALSKGQGALRDVQHSASKEGFLDRILGTNCFSTAVDKLAMQCNRMSQDQKYRLALELLKCHQHQVGSAVLVCTQGMAIQQCLAGMSDRDHNSFIEFLTNIDSMCLFIQNQNFQTHTEHMMEELFRGASMANDIIKSLLPAMAAQSEQLQDVSQEMQHMRLAQSELSQGIQHNMHSLHTLTGQAHQLGAGLQATLQNGAATLAQQQSFKQSLEEHEKEEARHAQQAAQHWQDAHRQAQQLAADQGKSQRLQEALHSNIQLLSKESASMRSTLNMLTELQQRSSTLLVALLGKSYSIEDVMFYAAGLLAALASASLPPTRQARMPLLCLLAACLALERSIPSWMHGLLEADASGRVLLNPAKMFWWPLQHDQGLDFKRTIRTTFLLAAVAISSLTAVRFFRRQHPQGNMLAQHAIPMEELAHAAERRHAEALQKQNAELVASLVDALYRHSEEVSSMTGLRQAKTTPHALQDTGLELLCREITHSLPVPSGSRQQHPPLVAHAQTTAQAAELQASGDNAAPCKLSTCDCQALHTALAEQQECPSLLAASAIPSKGHQEVRLIRHSLSQPAGPSTKAAASPDDTSQQHGTRQPQAARKGKRKATADICQDRNAACREGQITQRRRNQ